MCSGYRLVSSKLAKMLGFKGYLPLPLTPTPRSKPELGQPLLSREHAKLRGRGKTKSCTNFARCLCDIHRLAYSPLIFPILRRMSTLCFITILSSAPSQCHRPPLTNVLVLLLRLCFLFVSWRSGLTCDTEMEHFLASSSLASSLGYGLLRWE